MFPTLRTLAAGRTARRMRWAAALVCLLLAGLSAVGSSRAAPAAPARGVAVVVVARDLPAGHLLRAADLRTVHLPSAARPGGAGGDRTGYVGRRLAAPMTAREPLVAPRLLGRGVTTGLPTGTVATAVSLDSDVAGLVRAGDRVDLVATPGPDDAGDRAARAPTPQTLVPAARVLAVLGGSDAGAGADDSGPRLVLAVTHRQALQIAAARVSDVFTVVARAP